MTTKNDLTKIENTVRTNMAYGVYCPLNAQSCLSLIEEIKELRAALEALKECDVIIQSEPPSAITFEEGEG